MSTLLLLTPSTQSSVDVLPALALLPHTVKIVPPDVANLVDAPPHDLVLVDGQTELTQVRSLTRMLRNTGLETPLVLILNDGGLPVVTADWGVDDIVLAQAGPAEVDARIRLACGRLAAEAEDEGDQLIRAGELTVDEHTYTAKLDRRTLDLTFKEFELLKFLAQHPGRVFSRQQLLQDVWGYDYFGGARTVDVHVRRLRAKLGPDNETMIGTVRNVGYRFVTPAPDTDRDASLTAEPEEEPVR